MPDASSVHSYGLFDRILHHVALGAAPIREMFFDLEMGMSKPDPAVIAGERHLFVAGLARAGTTMLLRQCYATGAFVSLTYRDMPFVLAPGLWGRLSKRNAKAAVAGQRAHGDGVIVDVDSPEALDEVFWKTFESKAYLRSDRLVPMHASDETITRFRRYVAAILAAHNATATEQPQNRYLSKNNNNILRLSDLARAFTNCVIVVPFRHPLTQAQSLLRQHQRFADGPGNDKFTRQYMAYLAHHEFGPGHRPFVFDDSLPTGDPHGLTYWLDLWTNTYGWLLDHLPEQAVLLGYESFCDDPQGTWQALAQRADLPMALPHADPIRRHGDQMNGEISSLPPRTAQVYHALLDTAIEPYNACGP